MPSDIDLAVFSEHLRGCRRLTRAVGTHPAVQPSAIADYHINHSVLGGNQAIPQHEQARRLPTDPPNQKDVRNAIERVTVGATRIEILLNESVVAEGLDRGSRACPSR